MSGPITFPLRPEQSAIPVRTPAPIALPKQAIANSMPAGSRNSSNSHDPSVPARDFEALLIGQMLRSAHSSEDQEDSTGDTMWDMAAQQFSRVLADNGGLGLARIITQGLKSPVTTGLDVDPKTSVGAANSEHQSDPSLNVE